MGEANSYSWSPGTNCHKRTFLEKFYFCGVSVETRNIIMLIEKQFNETSISTTLFKLGVGLGDSFVF